MGHPTTASPRRRSLLRRRADRSSGQSLVEFALIFPIFVMLMLGIIEFAFTFNAVLSVSYASRDAALAGAESGNAAGSDCVILKAVEAAISAPTSDAKIQTVQIYQADSHGVMVGTPTLYTRNGVANAVPCAAVDGSTVPYAKTSDNYTEASRCNWVGGCGGVHPTVDNIAVRVTYLYNWVTPLHNFVAASASLTFYRESVMRMEPVL